MSIFHVSVDRIRLPIAANMSRQDDVNRQGQDNKLRPVGYGVTLGCAKMSTKKFICVSR